MCHWPRKALDDEVNEELNDVNASRIENNWNPDTNIHSNVPADKDRGLQIPANEVPDYFDYREKPDDEVSGESNKDDVKVSGIEDNAAVNDGNSQVNPSKDIPSD